MHIPRIKVIVFSILILGILFFISLYFGLAQHLIFKQQISRLSGSDRELAESEFYARNKAEHLLAGTIAKINLRGEGEVWVWTDQGLKYFQADKYNNYWLI